MMENKSFNPSLLLFGAIGHLLCWAGGDLLLYLVPNGPLDVLGLFDYEKTAAMLLDANPLQFTLSGVFGVTAMMLALPGYLQIAQFLKPASMRAARIVQVGAALTCIAGAVMHFTCTSMLWHFVRFGATPKAHEIMLSFFFETAVTSGMCNIGVLLVCITLLVTVWNRRTCLPRAACLVNTLPFTLVAGIMLAGMGAMNVGSAAMFLGLYLLLRKKQYFSA